MLLHLTITTFFGAVVFFLVYGCSEKRHRLKGTHFYR